MSNSKNRLGKGLDALIPTEIDEFMHSSMPKELTKKGAQIEEISPESIVANPDQPRSRFDQESLDELTSSIKVHGIIQPLVVIELSPGKYQLVAGERRMRAAQQAKLKTVPVIVRTFTQQQQLELALIENIQRAELTVLEQAAAFQKLSDQFGLTAKQIGQRVGKAETTIINIIRLLNLPKEAKQALNKGLISEGHARTILSLSGDLPSQQHMLSMIIKRGLTVRQAEELARNYKKDNVVDEKKVVEGTQEEQAITTNLGKLFHTKVVIHKTAKGGRLVIEFNSARQLENIAKRILK